MIGAGLSGLAAAVALRDRRDVAVTVHEAAGHAGGRCRSFRDSQLGRLIDNGNHLLLSGNRAAFAYLRAIGAENRLVGPERAAFPFIDLATGDEWTIRPTAGVVPWWLLMPGRRVPGSRLSDYLRGLRLAWAGSDATVGRCLKDDGRLFRQFWEPLTVAALNTPAEEASARLLWPVLKETFGKGEAACRPRIAGGGLSEAFVEPALAALARSGHRVHFQARLRRIVFDDRRAIRLEFAGAEAIDLTAVDRVVLAVSPSVATDLVPGLLAPQGTNAIVNGHFLLPKAEPSPRFLGIVGGLSQWLFIRGDVASVTVSAADRLAGEDNLRLAERMWKEIVAALHLDPNGEATALPPHRIIKEKRATFAQTPADVARRPGCRTRWANLFLAGDWVDTGLPATIEGSVRSGNTAAAAVLAGAASP